MYVCLCQNVTEHQIDRERGHVVWVEGWHRAHWLSHLFLGGGRACRKVHRVNRKLHVIPDRKICIFKFNLQNLFKKCYHYIRIKGECVWFLNSFSYFTLICINNYNWETFIGLLTNTYASTRHWSLCGWASNKTNQPSISDVWGIFHYPSTFSKVHTSCFYFGRMFIPFTRL